MTAACQIASHLAEFNRTVFTYISNRAECKVLRGNADEGRVASPRAKIGSRMSALTHGPSGGTADKPASPSKWPYQEDRPGNHLGQGYKKPGRTHCLLLHPNPPSGPPNNFVSSVRDHPILVVMNQMLSSIDASINALGQHTSTCYTLFAIAAGAWTIVDIARSERSGPATSANTSASRWMSSVSDHLKAARCV